MNVDFSHFLDVFPAISFNNSVIEVIGNAFLTIFF